MENKELILKKLHDAVALFCAEGIKGLSAEGMQRMTETEQKGGRLVLNIELAPFAAHLVQVGPGDPGAVVPVFSVVQPDMPPVDPTVN